MRKTYIPKFGNFYKKITTHEKTTCISDNYLPAGESMRHFRW